MKKIIEIINEISNYTFSSIYKEIKEIIKNKYKDEILIVINSTGGDCDQAFAILDLLNMIPNKKIGITIGKCYSAANIIFLNCDEKYMTEHAVFMYHGVSVGLDENQYDIDNLKNHLMNLEYRSNRMNSLLSKKTKIPSEILEKSKYSSNNNFLFADDCLKYGIVDKIITNISEII